DRRLRAHAGEQDDEACDGRPEPRLAIRPGRASRPVDIEPSVEPSTQLLEEFRATVELAVPQVPPAAQLHGAGCARQGRRRGRPRPDVQEDAAPGRLPAEGQAMLTHEPGPDMAQAD